MENNEPEKEIDIFFEYENKECEIKDITHMLWLVYEDYYSLQKNDLYTKADNYDRLGIFLLNIHSLLYKTTKDMENTINRIYELKKADKSASN